MKQIKFKDLENNIVHGGIMMDDGNVICGCCGGIIESDEFEGNNKTHIILKVFPNWVNLDEEICGDVFDL